MRKQKKAGEGNNKENSINKKTEEATGEGKSAGSLVDRKIEERKNYCIYNHLLCKIDASSSPIP